MCLADYGMLHPAYVFEAILHGSVLFAETYAMTGKSNLQTVPLEISRLLYQNLSILSSGNCQSEKHTPCGNINQPINNHPNSLPVRSVFKRTT